MTPTFSDLGLSDTLLNAITAKGFTIPTPVQSETIPKVLQTDYHIIAQAQTGTGKTAAFGLPLLDLVDFSVKHTQALILVPTRELASQVCTELSSLSGLNHAHIVPVYGGQPIEVQCRAIRKGGTIIVGTPGRIIDHLKRKTLLVGKLDFLILDEADEMLNMGFIDDIESIMEHTPDNKRILLFSATIPERIKKLASRYIPNYELIKIKSDSAQKAPLTEQLYFEVNQRDKFEALCRIIDHQLDFYGMVFCKTKKDVDDINNRLIKRGYLSESIHGDINQAQRERTLERFKNKVISILVATDVAARGIDVDNLTHVINYSLPQDPESYVHRIGRTGRAGQTGTAITLLSGSEYRQLVFIQKLSNSTIERRSVPEVDTIIEIKKQSINDTIESKRSSDSVDRIYQKWAQHLLDDNNPVDTLATVLKHCFDSVLSTDQYAPIQTVSARKSDRSKKSFGNKALDDHGRTRIFIAKGRKDSMTPKAIIKLIQSYAQVSDKSIQQIQIMESFSFASLPFEAGATLIKRLKQENRGQRPLITYAKAK